MRPIGPVGPPFGVSGADLDLDAAASSIVSVKNQGPGEATSGFPSNDQLGGREQRLHPSFLLSPLCNSPHELSETRKE